jgi:hypothetical protein
MSKKLGPSPVPKVKHLLLVLMPSSSMPPAYVYVLYGSIFLQSCKS